jgi:hypothetical protein
MDWELTRNLATNWCPRAVGGNFHLAGSGFIRHLITAVLSLIATVVLSLITPVQSKEEIPSVFEESA